MNAHLALMAAVAVANLLLGVTVLSRQYRSSINRYFALFSLSVAAWTLSNGLALTYPHTQLGDLWPRLAFASASIIPLAFLFFASVFPTANPAAPKPVLSAFLITGLASFVASFTSLIVSGTIATEATFHLAYGPLHLPFAIYFTSCLSLSLFILIQKLTVLTGFQKLQVRYLFFGVLVAALGATITNLVIPLLFGSSVFSRYGPLFGLLMVAVIAHSIIRHRLMNIRLVVRRGSVYVLAAAIAGAVFTAILLLMSRLIGERPQDVPLSAQVAVVLGIAFAFQPLTSWIQTSLDRYLYREPYDYQRIIRTASQTISSTLDLKSLLQYICEVASRTLRPDFAAVFSRDPAIGTFSPAAWTTFANNGAPPEFDTITPESPIPRFLTRWRRPLLRDELDRRITGREPEAAVAHLLTLSGDVAVPMSIDNDLVGFLVLGPKLSGDAYFTEDLDLLTTLSSQAAVAANNAQLYRQVVLINEYIENILRTMDSGVITVDAAGKVAVCNSKAEQLTGLSQPLLTSLSVGELPSSLALQLQATLADGTPRLQVEATLPSDQLRGIPEIPIVSSTSALTDADGHILGALVVFSDLSKLRALESDKRRAERLAAFGTLVSGIAHEIKNPLVAIRTFAELLPERFTDRDFREDFARVVMTEVARIDDLVARLRGLAVPSPHSASAVDIREPITEALALLRAQIEQAHTTVSRDFRDPMPLVAIDAAQLKQLFLNLFINAIEAMGSGGELTVRITRRATTTVDGWVVVEVEDTGSGIPESIRSSIFDPFFTTKPRGSGLGLAICRGITDAHQGTIRAESDKERGGTTIVVDLPAANGADSIREQYTLHG